MFKTFYIVEDEKKIEGLKETLKEEGADKEEIENLKVFINHTLKFVDMNMFRIDIDSDISQKELLYYESNVIGLYEKAVVTEDYAYYALEGTFYVN